MSDPPLQRLPGGEPPTAALQTSGPQAAAENGDDEEEEEEEDMEDDVDSSRLERFMRERRRARSLPALFRGGVSGSDSGKRVKFADAFGLNLASVKHFSALEEPRIPSKVLARLRSFPPQQRDFLDELCASFESSLSTCVPQTGRTSEELEARAKRLRVSLETVTVTRFDVRGHIRVFAGCSDKEVGVRYTFDDWLSHVDAQALPVPEDRRRRPGLTGERFAFTMYTPPFLGPGSSVHFAVYLRSEEGEFWDNNEGQNYTLGYHSLPSMAPFVSAAFHAT